MKNKLPLDWKWTKLGEVADIIMGQSPPSDTYNEKQEGLPFFQGKAEFGARFPEVRKYCSKPVRIAEQNDILMSVRAPVGSLNIANQRCCIGRGLCAIKKSNCLNYLFLYHFLKSIEKSISEKGEGSTFTAINRKTIEMIEIPIPPLPIQQKIVSILEQAENLKQKREQANEEANKIIQGVFYKMFGDKNKEYPVQKLGNLCTTSSGGTPSRSKREYYGGNIPWVKSGELNKGIILDTEERINEEALKNSSAKYVEPNTVLLAMYGATAGKSALLKIKATTNQAVCAITPRTNLLSNLFLLYTLKTMEKVIVSKSIGGGQPNISQGIIRDLDIVLPPISLQNQFASIVEKIESIKQKQIQATTEINTLFDALIQKAFKGELTS